MSSRHAQSNTLQCLIVHSIPLQICTQPHLYSKLSNIIKHFKLPSVHNLQSNTNQLKNITIKQRKPPSSNAKTSSNAHQFKINAKKKTQLTYLLFIMVKKIHNSQKRAKQAKHTRYKVQCFLEARDNRSKHFSANSIPLYSPFPFFLDHKSPQNPKIFHYKKGLLRTSKGLKKV